MALYDATDSTFKLIAVEHMDGVAKIYDTFPWTPDTLEEEYIFQDLDRSYAGLYMSTAYANVKDPTYGATGGGVVDDQPAIQATVNAVNAAGGGTVLIPKGTYRITADVVTMKSNVTIRGEHGTKLIFVGTRLLACIYVPDGTNDWTIDGIEFAGLYSGTGASGNPAGSGVWARGVSRARISNCVAHHFDGSGFSVAANATTNATDVEFDNCTAYSNAIDGIEYNSAVGAVNVRPVLTDCHTYSNQANGVEITGDGLFADGLTIEGLKSHDNVNTGVIVDGPGGATASDIILTGIEANNNGAGGLNIGQDVDGVVFGQIDVHENTGSGVYLGGTLNVSGGPIRASGNSVRGIQIDTAAKNIDLTVNVVGNGASSSVGQAAVDVLSSGGVCSDISIRGTIKSNTRNGLQMNGVTRGKLDVHASGNNIAGGSVEVYLHGCANLTGFVSAWQGTGFGYGLGMDTSCTNNSFVLSTGPIGGTGSTTGWAISDAGSTANTIVEITNTCATKRSDSGTNTDWRGRYPSPVFLKAGAPVDGDFATPLNGLLALDTTNHRLYVRDGGVWKFAALT